MLLAAPLIDLPAAYRLLSAMPSGLNSLVVAHAYGLDMEITAEASPGRPRSWSWRRWARCCSEPELRGDQADQSSGDQASMPTP